MLPAWRFHFLSSDKRDYDPVADTQGVRSPDFTGGRLRNEHTCADHRQHRMAFMLMKRTCCRVCRLWLKFLCSYPTLQRALDFSSF